MEPRPSEDPGFASPDRQWTLRDIPLAIQVAFDLQKLAVGALGLLAACIAYGVFSWLGDQTGEKAAHRVFTVLGGIIATCVCVVFSGLIAKMTTVQLLENRRVGAMEMRAFARDRGFTLMAIPFAFGGIVILMLTFQSMLSMLGALPGIGPIIYSASFLVAFGMSLVAVLAGAVHTVGAFLYPSIVAIREGGAIGAMFEVVELARRQPLLLLVYEAIVAVVGGLMTLLIGVLVWASVHLSALTASAIMGDKFDRTMGAVSGFFRIFLHPLRNVVLLPELPMDVAWHYDLSGLFIGTSLLVLFVLTLVYPFVFFTSAGSVTYLILRPDPVPRERSPIEDL